MSGADTEGAVVDAGRGPPLERRPDDTKGSPPPELAVRELSSPVME
jgi:hypothetical protein